MKTQTSDLWIHKGSRNSPADQQHTSSGSFCSSCSFLTAARVPTRDFWMASPINGRAVLDLGDAVVDQSRSRSLLNRLQGRRTLEHQRLPWTTKRTLTKLTFQELLLVLGKSLNDLSEGGDLGLEVGHVAHQPGRACARCARGTCGPPSGQSRQHQSLTCSRGFQGQPS